MLGKTQTVGIVYKRVSRNARGFLVRLGNTAVDDKKLSVCLYGAFTVFYLYGNVSVDDMSLGIYKAIGFGSGSLRLSFAVSFGITALIGSLIGMLLAAAFTDPLASFVMKFAGISSFSSAPTVGNILLPLCIVVGLFTLFAYAASWKIKKLPLTVLIFK